MQQKNIFKTVNGWFFIPFALWFLVGGIIICCYNQRYLFQNINTHHNSFFDVLMPYITMMGEGFFGIIIMLLLLLKKTFRVWKYVLVAILCNALPAIIVQIIKGYYNEPRPMAVFNKASWIHILPQWEVLMENSFPSGHTSAAFCLFAFLSMILTQQKKIFGLLFFLLSLSVAYSRIYLAAHFFQDVYAASLIAVFFNLIVFYVIKPSFNLPSPPNKIGTL